MNSVSAPPLNAGSTTKLLPRAAWIVALGIASYFVITRVPRYFVLTPQSYGPYFWPRASQLLTHVLAGLVATLIGPLQFWSRIRRDHIRVHRLSGRIYLASVVIGGIAGLVLAATSKISLTYAAGLTGLACVWLTTSGMAFVAIRNRNIVQHRQWMIRSYVVTMGFVSFRLVEDLLAYWGIGTQIDRLTVMSWASWSVPLFFTEIAFQAKSVLRGR